MLAVMAKFFPAPGSSEFYCNKPSEYDEVVDKEVFSSLVSSELASKLYGTGRVPSAGDVKYIFSTRSGPGPLAQPLSEALIDFSTGLPKAPGPQHKRMKLC